MRLVLHIRIELWLMPTVVYTVMCSSCSGKITCSSIACCLSYLPQEVLGVILNLRHCDDLFQPRGSQGRFTTMCKWHLADRFISVLARVLFIATKCDVNKRLAGSFQWMNEKQQRRISPAVFPTPEGQFFDPELLLDIFPFHVNSYHTLTGSSRRHKNSVGLCLSHTEKNAPSPEQDRTCWCYTIKMQAFYEAVGGARL